MGAEPRITQAADDSQRITLRGNVHPMARPAFDRGVAPANLPMQRMLMVLKRSPAQESALQQLLDSQQDKASPNFHKWLTPGDFGKQFGPADSDVQAVSGWLQAHGFEVTRVSKGRSVIEFSGDAGRVQEAFHTAIHKFTVQGEDHWANASDPEIPAALAPVVAGINTLNNFPRRSLANVAGVVSRSKATGQFQSEQPLFTLPVPGSGCGVQNGYCYGVGPYDFATIYNVLPLWTATPAINGAGQTIAVVGDSDVNPQDVTDFRNFFGLPTVSLQTLHDGPDPGISGSETEADLDTEWSGAVAPGANIDLVVAESTETALGVDLAAERVVDDNLAPILSESFGICELFLGTAGNQFYSQLWQQASAQGITVLLASGDSGSAGCDDHGAQPPAPAQFGLAVSGFASTPYTTTVGGTDFFDLTNGGTYWNTANTITTQASALSYIPETTWNDSCTNPVFGTLLNFSTNAETNCNNQQLVSNFVLTVGGSGGKSSCTTSNGQTAVSCSGGYAKPSWQTALTPADGKRDIPDVSLFSSSGSPSGSFYVICEADLIQGATSCNPTDSNTEFISVGGTSASAPAMAGIMALVEQKVGSRLGNANYVLYKLAGQQTPANCNSSNGSGSTCVFNDVTTGTIAMPCTKGSSNCTTNAPADRYGILSGYSAVSGYDLATGLGSVNAANLVAKWSAVTLTPSVTTLNSLTPTTITHGQAVSVSIGVAPQTGSGTPTGTVSLISDLSTNNAGIGSFTLNGSGVATGTTNALPGGTYHVTAHYAGDGTFGASDSSPVSVTVNKESSTSSVGLVLLNVVNGQVVSTTNGTTAGYSTPYFLRANVFGTTCPNNAIDQTGCPTGTLTITDNGAPLDGGAFALNRSGYMEDQPINLQGGTHSIRAQYSGDNSFTSSSALATISITPAVTTIISVGPDLDLAGAPVNFGATIQSPVFGGATPTGPITFYANGTPLSGTLTVESTGTSINGVPSANPFLQVHFTTVIPTPGTYAFTTTYGGDTNYLSSSSLSSTAQVKFQGPAITFNLPTGVTFPEGQSATLTAIMTGGSKTIAPTGTVTFNDSWTQLPVSGGTVSYAPGTDTNGNATLLATLTFTPTLSGSLLVTYSGDNDYVGSNTFLTWRYVVPGNDFGLESNVPSVTIDSPGQTANVGLDVATQADFNGVINWSPSSCAGLPAETTCAFQFSTTTGTSVNQMTITTTAAHPATQARPSPFNTARSTLWSFGFGTIGIFLFGGARRKWKGGWLSAVLLVALFVLPSCGGGSIGNGGGGVTTPTDPGTPAGTYTVTVTATSGSVTRSLSFPLIVK